MRAEFAATLRVMSGPFTGMVYPLADATGSMFPPKILGCYEQELHAVVEEAVQRRPQIVLDIGCAEGYYAVGLARRLEGIEVRAYDTNARAISLLGAMAEANGVKKADCRRLAVLEE